MAKSHRRSQKLTEAVYGQARKRMLAILRQHLERLDTLYEQDAAAIKAELRRILGIAGVPARRVDRMIDDVLEGSREKRLEVLEQAVRDGAKTAHGLDQQTFDAVFGGEADTPPKAEPASGFSPTPKRSLRLVSESADE